MKADQLAINTVSLDASDLPATLEAIVAAGFRKVEFAMGQVRRFLETGRTVEDLRRTLERHDLACIGGFERGVQCWGTPEALQADQEHHLEVASLLAALGGTNMVVGTDGPPEGGLTPEGMDRIVTVYRSLAERLDPLGVNVLLEFNWGVVKSVSTAFDICQQVDHPRVGILFDPAHFRCTPSKTEMLTPETVGRIYHVHVNNMSPTPPEFAHCNEDRLLPDDPAGVFDLNALFGAIESAGYTGDFSIEMFSKDLWGQTPADAARRLYASLEGLID